MARVVEWSDLGVSLPTAAAARASAPAHWTIGRVVRRAIEILRGEGPRVLWFQVLGETVYRRMAIYHQHLDGRLEGLAARIPVRIAPLAESDLAEYEKLRPDIGASEARRRLQEGQFCWIAWSAERMAGEIWANPRSGWIEYLQCELPLRDGQVYVYQNFTSQAFRHQGISGVLLGTARESMRHLGYRATIGVIRPDKASSRMPATKVVGRIGYWQFAGRRRYFLRWFASKTTGPATGEAWESAARRMASSGYRLDPALAEIKRAAHLRLFDRWVSVPAEGLCLKTDAFEEAFGGDALLDDLARRARGAVAFDISVETARRARARLGGGARILTADVRRLPFADASFALVVSTSTLDHFADARDIGVSLRELARVLRPGGRMIVTMDNRQNLFDPLLRAASRLGLTPYYLGRSCTIAELVRELEAAGMRVVDRTAILHGPRLVPTLAMNIAGRFGGVRARTWVRRRLEAAEKLEHSRWRYRTGAFVAALAEK